MSPPPFLATDTVMVSNVRTHQKGKAPISQTEYPNDGATLSFQKHGVIRMEGHGRHLQFVRDLHTLPIRVWSKTVVGKARYALRLTDGRWLEFHMSGEKGTGAIRIQQILPECLGPATWYKLKSCPDLPEGLKLLLEAGEDEDEFCVGKRLAAYAPEYLRA